LIISSQNFSEELGIKSVEVVPAFKIRTSIFFILAGIFSQNSSAAFLSEKSD